MKYDLKDIGNKIRMERKRKRLSQAELLDMLDEQQGVQIGRNALSSIENGDECKSFNLQFIQGICNIFDCDTEYLLGENGCLNPEAREIKEITGLPDLASNNLCIAINNYQDGPIKQTLANAREEKVRNYEIGRVVKIRFLQLLLENDDLWERISVCAYDFIFQKKRKDIFKYSGDIYYLDQAVLEKAKKELSNLFERLNESLFDDTIG